MQADHRFTLLCRRPIPTKKHVDHQSLTSFPAIWLMDNLRVSKALLDQSILNTYRPGPKDEFQGKKHSC